jgi:hypothetical protein
MIEEENVPAETAEDADGLALDERARIEIAREKGAAAGAAVENLRHVSEPQVSEEQLAKDDLNARLATSNYGRGLTSRQVEHGTQQILAWEQAHGMAQSERMAKWIGDDNHRLGYVMRKAAEGELSAPPSEAELNAVGAQISARKELDEIYAKHPPGTAEHSRLMPRIQQLWNIESAGTPVVGKSLRNV